VSKRTRGGRKMGKGSSNARTGEGLKSGFPLEGEFLRVPEKGGATVLRKSDNNRDREAPRLPNQLRWIEIAKEN